MIRIGVPKEIHPDERRAAVTPQTVMRLIKLGFEVAVETGAGRAIDCFDGTYREAGAIIVNDTRELWASSDVVIKVRPPEQNEKLGVHEVDLMREGGWLVGFIWAGQNKELLKRFSARKATVFGMDSVPRITRAQKMDALSAMANIAGYRSVIEAANHFSRFFGGQMTAAGRVDPAKVLVIGAGVAGLSAIGAARNLGAIVRAFDPRSATRDQVKSMGAEFLDLDIKEEGEGKGGYAKEMSDAFLRAEMALFAQQAMEVDIIITTALIPGKPAPKLITTGMVESMKPGSVIVDLAAEQGGNCAMTEPGKVVTHKGITIIGYTDLPSRMASLSSQLYGSTIASLLEELQDKETGALTVDYDNEVSRGALVVHEGKITYPPPMPPPAPEPGVAAKTTPTAAVQAANQHAAGHDSETSVNPLWLALAGAALLGIGFVAPATKLSHFTVFMLACFVGWQVVWNVKPALHTPLMSVTNAISGIILVGGMLQLSGVDFNLTTILGAIAVLIAAVNIAGGFLVTNRMLAMFRK
ncbi:MAG TPA: Re/Si-specific NAD(P)(+) transhydrogenase subunit alpha [Pyrinomonadaceae bacterium]|nr:Re/Si-specific NAD(P)(+) transhydrogenase subunit alpha [Pyrinomonadaceae bacterium]